MPLSLAGGARMARRVEDLVEAVRFQQTRGSEDEEWAVVEEQLTLI